VEAKYKKSGRKETVMIYVEGGSNSNKASVRVDGTNWPLELKTDGPLQMRTQWMLQLVALLPS
jgi:uncharacterized protein (DUF1501 family)